MDVLTDSAHVARYPDRRVAGSGRLRSGAGRLALIRRVPMGPVLAITPFNFPLMLVAHKLGPAIAAGCPVVLKPASARPPLRRCCSPRSSPRRGCRPAASRCCPRVRAHMAALVRRPAGFALLTFTGSAEVGWGISGSVSPTGEVALELGSNAAGVVEPDAGDLEPRCRDGWRSGLHGFAGQSCISVQRILVHQAIYEPFRELLTAAVRAVPAGDPLDERHRVRPAHRRAATPTGSRRWIDEAVESGGTLLAGGDRHGNVVSPTLLETVPPTSRWWPRRCSARWRC